MKFDVAKGPAVLQGVVLEVERATGRALSIEPFLYRERAS
jgi:calcineurin-like phosphoesterase